MIGQPSLFDDQSCSIRILFAGHTLGYFQVGDLTNLSERKLMDCLNRLGHDIEINVRPASEPVGHLTLATA